MSTGRAIFGLGALLAVTAALSVSAQQGPGPAPLASLKGVAVPVPADLDVYVRDKTTLVALGKAFFWDVQVGSDGRTACASCHFHAGADHRRRNVLASPTDVSVGFPVNQSLSTGDFPFHAFADPANNASAVTRDSRFVVGSTGIVAGTFVDVRAGNAADLGTDPLSPGPFSAGGIRGRQATSRNAPSVINAVFNVRNFWDGRAHDVFTGATPFGDSDPAANVYTNTGSGLAPTRVRLLQSSLASQATGPPLNATEMSYDGRSWSLLGRKMFGLAPLARQQVSASDSVLGAIAGTTAGLQPADSYAALVRAAFQPAYWNSTQTIGSRNFTQMEANFGFFWGVAIQAYESTLVSDDSPLDRFLAGDNAALTQQQQAGLRVFQGPGRCNRCHGGPETTAAGITSVGQQRPNRPQDFGFFITGVRPAGDDKAAAGTDSFGVPFFQALPVNATTGAFKASSLRNVELTGPYFHTGGAASLAQVIDFYARHGDFPGANVDQDVAQNTIQPQDHATLIALMQAMTDDRVRFERAPFDHPALCVSVGEVESAPGALQLDTTVDSRTSALDQWALIPAVGRAGNTVTLQTFDELLSGTGNDGSRAHALQQTCKP